MADFVLTTPDLKRRDMRLAETSISMLPQTDVSIWSSLASNIGDIFSWKKEPPLELTSQPVAVADILAVERSPASSALSFVVHTLVIGLILWLAFQAHNHATLPLKMNVTHVDITPFIPMTVPAPKAMGGGGGGGAHQVVEPIKGRVPPMTKTQVAPPQLLVVDHPKLAVQPSIVMPQQIKLPDSNMPNLGVQNSPQVAMASQGSGAGSGFGSGSGGGIGSGSGNGMGPGSGGGYGGGVMSVGGGVSAPQVIHSVDPEFTDEARRAKHEGIVSIQLIVDSQGNPQNPQVVRPLGMGLDQKAMEAVRQYKFRPAMYQGHPVPVRVVIDVAFHLY